MPAWASIGFLVGFLVGFLAPSAATGRWVLNVSARLLIATARASQPDLLARYVMSCCSALSRNCASEPGNRLRSDAVRVSYSLGRASPTGKTISSCSLVVAL